MYVGACVCVSQESGQLVKAGGNVLDDLRHNLHGDRREEGPTRSVRVRSLSVHIHRSNNSLHLGTWKLQERLNQIAVQEALDSVLLITIGRQRLGGRHPGSPLT